ncbi:hypothetical protein ACIQVL_48695 [Streptomyces sp. NPDC090499]|uniref:hypothetical protein n=1 Tax=Streptomyces sp. NPDC090499 TaxID=3365965 RepID=UPI0038018B02
MTVFLIAAAVLLAVAFAVHRLKRAATRVNTILHEEAPDPAPAAAPVPQQDSAAWGGTTA